MSEQLKYSTLNNDIMTRRNRLHAVMDEFCTFEFDGHDMWEEFGAFIINEKNSLKFYNGPSFQNEYTKPQFANYTQLSGVTFQTQKIQFKVGLYWIDIATYRKFLQVINPLKIGMLSFSFSSEWQYQVKLASIADSPRYIIGRMSEGAAENQYAYYTELTLNWEIQGEACVRSVLPYPIRKLSEDNYILGLSAATNNNAWSDLSTPFKLSFSLTPNTNTSSNPNGCYLKITATYKDTSETLLSVQLQNPAVGINGEESITLYLTYNSESGTVYYTYGGDQYKILSSLDLLSNGQKLASNLLVNKFWIPGNLEYPGFQPEEFKIQIQADGWAVNWGTQDPSAANFEVYKRTNVI